METEASELRPNPDPTFREHLSKRYSTKNTNVEEDWILRNLWMEALFTNEEFNCRCGIDECLALSMTCLSMYGYFRFGEKCARMDAILETVSQYIGERSALRAFANKRPPQITEDVFTHHYFSYENMSAMRMINLKVGALGNNKLVSWLYLRAKTGEWESLNRLIYMGALSNGRFDFLDWMISWPTMFYCDTQSLYGLFHGAVIDYKFSWRFTKDLSNEDGDSKDGVEISLHKWASPRTTKMDMRILTIFVDLPVYHGANVWLGVNSKAYESKYGSYSLITAQTLRNAFNMGSMFHSINQ